MTKVKPHVSIDEEIYKMARDAGISISKTCENALRSVLIKLGRLEK